MEFNEKLQKLRKDKKLSQEQLAEKLNVSRQAVSKWESGVSYPEMDKLVAMSRIFKCSLDELVNDKKINKNSEKEESKNYIDNFIKSFFDLINRSINMFKSMNSTDIIKCILTMIVVIIVIGILHVPIDHIYNLGESIFMNFGFRIGNILSSIWSFVLEISYLTIGIIILVHVYKLLYLNNYNDSDNSKDTTENKPKTKEDNKNLPEVAKEPSVKQVHIEKDPKSSSIFGVLVSIFKIFIKFIVIIMSIPFIISLFVIIIMFSMSIGVIFKGVILIGIIITLLSAVVLNVFILEIIFNFIFDKKNKVKRLFICFIFGIVGLGIGFGISFLQLSDVKYVNNPPEEYKLTVKSSEFEMKPNYFILHNYNTDYIEDNSLKNKIKIELTYYEDFTEVNFNKIYADNDNIYIDYNYKENVNFNNIFTLLKNDIKTKTFHNYTELFDCHIKVYGSKENILLLQKNKWDYNKKMHSYEERIEDYLDEAEYNY